MEHGADPAPIGIPLTRSPDGGPDRPPSRAERRAQTAYLLTVLSHALATQVGRLVASTDPAPDGWWFDPESERRGVTTR